MKALALTRKFRIPLGAALAALLLANASAFALEVKPAPIIEDIDEDEEELPLPFEIGRKPAAIAEPLQQSVIAIPGLPAQQYETFLKPPQTYPAPAGDEDMPATDGDGAAESESEGE